MNYGLPVGKKNRIEYFLYSAGLKCSTDDLHKLIERPYDETHKLIRMALRNKVKHPRRKIYNHFLDLKSFVRVKYDDEIKKINYEKDPDWIEARKQLLSKKN